MASDIRLILTDESDNFCIHLTGAKNDVWFRRKTLPAAYQMIQNIKSILSVAGKDCEVSISPRLEKLYKSYETYDTDMEMYDLVKNGAFNKS